MRKTVIAAAMAASLTLGGAAGAALFVPSASGARTGAQTNGTAAEPDDGSPRHGFLTEALAPLVDDGTITRAQAEAVVDAIVDARPPRHGHRHRFPFGSAVTDVLGIDAAELRSALRDGRTIAEVAEANGVPVDDVVAALVAEVDDRLATAVEDGRLTEEEAETKLAAATEHITALVHGDGDVHRNRHLGPRHDGAADDTAGS